MIGRPPVDAKIRFWAKVKIDLFGCWEWQGCKAGGRRGMREYGIFRTSDGVDVGAHRFSWELHFGLIPKGMKVLHKCDKPACVRPSHLFRGTQKENIQDCIRKGRRAKTFKWGPGTKRTWKWGPNAKRTWKWKRNRLKTETR